MNNDSTDGTRSHLNSLDDPRLTIAHHDANIGQNAYARAFALMFRVPFFRRLNARFRWFVAPS